MVRPCIGILLLLLVSGGYTSAKGDERHHLFKVSQNGKVGFIDSTGYFVIKPQFLSANDFSEGLAAVRVGGTYGFIDESGRFVIEPQYDYATQFHEGLAVVYSDGKPFFIDRSGNKAFENYFPFVGPFRNGRAKVSTGLHEGYISKTGALIIDTVYERIYPFVDGHAKVENNKAEPFGDGVIGRNGKLIVPFGRYDEISNFYNGYFCGISKSKAGGNASGLEFHYTCMDTLGNVIFKLADSLQCLEMRDFSCGLAQVVLRTKHPPEDVNGGKLYVGFVNIKGAVSIRNTDFLHATNFSKNRAFLWDQQHFSLMDTKGVIIADKAYTGVQECWPLHSMVFSENRAIAFVRGKNKWGLIDTNGRFVIRPRYDGIYGMGANDDYFFFKNEIGKTRYGTIYLIGVANLKGKVLIPPVMEDIDRNGFQHGLLKCSIDRRPAYINMKGEIVWQQDSIRSGKLEDMDIDYLNDAEFAAKKMVGPMIFPPGQLSVNVRTAERDTFRKVFNGLRVYVANTAGKKIFFPADANQLEMNVQALDQHGNWRDIEYVPHTGCGNNFHSISLDTNEYWTFVTPVYSGGFKTKLRIALEYLPKATADVEFPEFNDSNVGTVYSNTYGASINPAQFWREQGSSYDPGGLDPYSDTH